MKEIGKKLQEKRIAAGLDIEAVSAKTRLTPKHIKALEEGDISFFHDDLSYVRFFVKSYCEVVGADFDDLKDDLRKCIDSYTTDIVVGKQNETEQKNRKIVSNIQEHKPKVSVGETSSKRKHTDTSFVSLIAVFVVIALLLGGAAFMWLNQGDKQEPSQNDLPIAEVEKDDKEDKNQQNQSETKPDNDKDQDKDQDKVEVKEMNIEMKTPTSYVIDHVKEGETLKIETTFNGSSSGYSLTINGKDVKEEGVYQFQQTATSEIKVEKNMKISLYIGCMVNTDIKINGKVVKTDKSINPSVFPGACPSQTIDFEIGALN